jgi:YD repeat-containing protein
VWRTIDHYQPQGTSAPGDWVWANNQWEYSPGNPVSHGSDNTGNIIADTDYNDLGLVRLRRDALGSVTLYGYDDAGRLVKTVQNAATPDHNNDYIGSLPNEADPA